MTKQAQLQAVLDEATAEVTDIHAAVLASQDGLAMATTIGGAEGGRVAAMAATIHAVGRRATEAAELGTIEEAVIRGKEVTFVVYDAGDAAVLALMAPGDCNLGMVHLEGRRAADAIRSILDQPSSLSLQSSIAPPPPPTPATNGTPPRGSHEREVEGAPA